MSQNQSYFWQTTRRNVYLKRSAKMQMLFALMAVLAFSTICVAEEYHALNEENSVTGTLPTNVAPNEGKIANPDMMLDGNANEAPNADTTKETGGSKTGFVDAFTASISVILVTELGDKTFFIAAIMAMRHPRLIVFAGAIIALALMTVLSVVFGMAATIIPKVYTYYISTALFAIFGLKMIYEGYVMKPTDAQEELEEVQSDLRKREDELMRSKRGKYEDGGSDGKRKNSNSDKEEDSGAGAAGSSKGNAVTNPEMQHRQRKQLNNYHNNNNNKSSNGCELNNDDDSIGDCHETDVFLEGGHRKHEMIKMSTFHNSTSSPALSSSAISNQTTQTNCDDEFLANNTGSSNRNFKGNGTNDEHDTPQSLLQKKQRGHKSALAMNSNGGSMTMIHASGSAASSLVNMNGSAANLGSKASINSVGSHSIKSAGTVSASAGLDGSKRRLERNVSANVVQDPESGMLRKNTKKGAAYVTTRVFMQAFTMTFLAEWGDRSQLTTIILAASKNVYGVISGGIIGHSICTGLAVIGGRMVAAKISVRTVTIVGGIVFLGFALYALIVRPDDI